MDLEDIALPKLPLDYVQNVMGYVASLVIGQNQDPRIRKAWMENCEAELILAAGYCLKNEGKGKEKEKLSELERLAFENLWEVMAYNGGIQNLGNTINAFGAPLVDAIAGPIIGTAVNIATKRIPNDGHVPTPEQFRKMWLVFDMVFTPIALATAFALPELFLLEGLGAVISANTTAFSMHKKIKAWDMKYNVAPLRQEFFNEIGEIALEKWKIKRDTFTSEKARESMLKHAEDAFEAIAKGPGEHTEEDVRTLRRYLRIAGHMFPKDAEQEIENDSPGQFERHHALMSALEKGKFAEHLRHLTASDKVYPKAYKRNRPLDEGSPEAYQAIREAFHNPSSVRQLLLDKAETAAAHLAEGKGQHTAHDVDLLCDYNNVADAIFVDLDGYPVSKHMAQRHASLQAFIDASRVVENKDLLTSPQKFSILGFEKRPGPLPEENERAYKLVKTEYDHILGQHAASASRQGK